MQLLIIGGTGNISWRLATAAVETGWKVTLLNRGGVDRKRRPSPAGCSVMIADINDQAVTKELLGGSSFDAVVDFLCFGAAHAQRAIDYFSQNTGHYIFISSTAVYDRRIAKLPLSENSPIISDGWDYAIAKAHAERVFTEAHQHTRFPVTILRAAHTYDTIIPDAVGEGDWTNPWRLLSGKPIVIHDDGTTLWTLTHSLDFANGVIKFLESNIPPGGIFQIASDKAHTWREIVTAISDAVGVRFPQVCYRTTAEIAAVSPRLAKGITGHKMWSDVYDNDRFKMACPEWRGVVSLENGLSEAVRYFRSSIRLQVPNQQLNDVLEQLCSMRPATPLCEQSNQQTAGVP